jgi:hypothetical protein
VVRGFGLNLGNFNVLLLFNRDVVVDDPLVARLLGVDSFNLALWVARLEVVESVRTMSEWAGVAMAEGGHGGTSNGRGCQKLNSDHVLE